jgi:hypothetical protein
MQVCSVAFGVKAVTNERFGAKREKFGPEIGHKNTAHNLLPVKSTARTADLEPDISYEDLTQNLYFCYHYYYYYYS